MKALRFLLKLTFVAALLYFLVKKGALSISLNETRRALSQLDLILPACGILLLTSALGIIRWHGLLEAQDISLSWFKTFELAMVGNFFNIALPGAVSGDVVKAFYVGREAPGARAKAFGSILFDRILGLSAMVLLATGALLIGFDHFWDSSLFHAIRLFLVVAACGFVVFFSYLFFLNEKRDIVLKTLTSLSKKVKPVGSVLRIYEGVKGYHARKWAVTRSLLLSGVIQFLVGTAFVLFLRAFGGADVPALTLYIVVPLGLLVTAIPLLPGGVGTGHAAFGFLFGLCGSQRGADVFTLFALFNILMGAFGGLIYLRFKSAGQLPDLQRMKA